MLWSELTSSHHQIFGLLHFIDGYQLAGIVDISCRPQGQCGPYSCSTMLIDTVKLCLGTQPSKFTCIGISVAGSTHQGKAFGIRMGRCLKTFTGIHHIQPLPINHLETLLRAHRIPMLVSVMNFQSERLKILSLAHRSHDEMTIGKLQEAGRGLRSITDKD